ncbi:hypothetical protein PFISCL1PPCAC_15987, partial [Pristionchus fissidentatus]
FSYRLAQWRMKKECRIDPGRFHPAPLPKWELTLSYAFWGISCITSFVLAYRVCNGPLRPWMEHSLQPSRIVSGWKFDPSDSEWQSYTGTLGGVLLAYAAHSLIFNAAYRLLSNEHARLVQIVAGVLLHVWMVSYPCIF